ncbi:D-inositol 3-phosphate glycosyltransferase [Methanothermobacter sp. EMTCatA1]|nr:D-inositol 3-phosphate glycosyltransferase [Methanothermobacter sp. EMTCatA1]
MQVSTQLITCNNYAYLHERGNKQRGFSSVEINYFITHFPYKTNFLNKSYFTQYKHGGAEVAAYYLALNMAKYNNIKVFTTSIKSKDSLEEYRGLQIHRYATITNNISLKLFMEPLNYDADIVHAHFSTPPAEIAAILYAKKKKIPFVLTYHGDWQEGFGSITRRIPLYFYNKFLIQRVLNSADVIIAPSKYYINESRFLKGYKGKIVVIPNAINIEDFKIPLKKEECRQKLDLPHDKNIILFLGNLIQYKGPDILINAMKLVLERVPDTELIIVGDGPMKRELKKLSKALNIEKNIRFAGFIGNTFRKALYYKASDIFCLPSTMSTESFGIVNLEAMACGLPVVASKIGGIPDIIKNEETGLLVPPRNPHALAETIVYLLNDKKLRERMSSKGERIIEEEYSWNKVARMTEEVYTDLL